MFEQVWQNIKLHEGGVFYTMRGLTLTYKAYFRPGEDGYISIIREGRLINQYLFKSQFEKMYNIQNFKNLSISSFNDIRGASYVYAILSDSRIS